MTMLIGRTASVISLMLLNPLIVMESRNGGTLRRSLYHSVRPLKGTRGPRMYLRLRPMRLDTAAVDYFENLRS